MDNALTSQLEDIKKYDLKHYRYFYLRQENGLAWLFIVTTIEGEFKVTSMYYDNPKNLNFSEIEAYREELERQILKAGEVETFKKTGPMEILLSTFDRQFQGKVSLEKELLFYIDLAIGQFDLDRNPERYLNL